MQGTIRRYYRLTKPGIVYGNSLTAAGGFLLGCGRHIDALLGVATLLGIAGVMASACVFNNYIDRHIDAKMDRTKKRALVTHSISTTRALLFGAVLGIVGFALLFAYTNTLTVWLGVVAFVVYLAVYGYAKRVSVHGTLVGGIAGSLPPVAGYTAVVGGLDATAWWLFIIMAVWQMAHFYAIAIYRRDDYAHAGLPVISVKYGADATRRWVIGYITVYIPAAIMLSVYGRTGYTYAIVMAAAGMGWLWRALTLPTADKARWGRKVFGSSLLVLLVFSAMIAVDAWLP